MIAVVSLFFYLKSWTKIYWLVDKTVNWMDSRTSGPRSSPRTCGPPSARPGCSVAYFQFLPEQKHVYIYIYIYIYPISDFMLCPSSYFFLNNIFPISYFRSPISSWIIYSYVLLSFFLFSSGPAGRPPQGRAAPAYKTKRRPSDRKKKDLRWHKTCYLRIIKICIQIDKHEQYKT